MALPLIAAVLVGVVGYAVSQEGKEARTTSSGDVQKVQRPDAAPHPLARSTGGPTFIGGDSPYSAHPPPCFKDTCAGDFSMQGVDTRGGGGDTYSAFKARNLELLSGHGPQASKVMREGFQAAPSADAWASLAPMFPPEMAIRAPPGVKGAGAAVLQDRAKVIGDLQTKMKGCNTVAPPDTQLQVPRRRDAPPAARLPMYTDLQTRGKKNQINPGHQRAKVPEAVAFTYNNPRLKQSAPAPLRSGAGVGGLRPGSRVPGVGVRAPPNSGAIQIRNTMRRVAAVAPCGPVHNIHNGKNGLWRDGEQDKAVMRPEVASQAGVAHASRGTWIDAPQAVRVVPESRVEEEMDRLPGPASRGRRFMETPQQFTDTSVAGTMRECDGAASHIAGGAHPRAQRDLQMVAAVDSTMPVTMRACDMTGGVPGAATAHKKPPTAAEAEDAAMRLSVTGRPEAGTAAVKRPARAAEGGDFAARLSVIGRPEAGAAAVKKAMVAGGAQEATARVVAEAPTKLEMNGDGSAPSATFTVTRDGSIADVPGPVRASAQRLPGDSHYGWEATQQQREELLTDRGFEGMAVGRQALRGNTLTHRTIPSS